MDGLSLSTVLKNDNEGDQLSDKGCCRASLTVVFDANGLIEKGGSCRFPGNKNKEERAVADDEREEI